MSDGGKSLPNDFATDCPAIMSSDSDYRYR